MELIEPKIENICAVIVTANADDDFTQRLRSISKQVSLVVIVDNNSDIAFKDILRTVESNDKMHIIYNDTNEGIAAALNKGIFHAKDLGLSWVIMLDHDSIAKSFMIDTYLNIYNELKDLGERVGIIGCNHLDSNSHEYYINPNKYPPKKWIKRKTVITSGTFIPIALLSITGPLREDFFLDGVDHEFCLRARKNGFNVFLILKPLLSHTMGNRRPHFVPFIRALKIYSTNYEPFRWYFITRNRLILVRTYLLREPIWAIASFFRLIGWILIMLMTERKRNKKLKFILLGLKDSLKNNISKNIKNVRSAACDVP